MDIDTVYEKNIISGHNIPNTKNIYL